MEGCKEKGFSNFAYFPLQFYVGFLVFMRQLLLTQLEVCVPLSESVSEYTSENRNISYERKYLFKQSPGMFGGKKRKKWEFISGYVCV